MPVTVIVGLQWGDEGKGKIVDYLGEKYDLFVRYNGGNNAGHTVIVNGERYALHFVPSGVVRGKKVAIGNGCVVEPNALLQEIRDLESRGIKVDLVLDERAHIITPEYMELDKKEGGKIGTTGRGIGPAYTAKVARRGMRVYEYAKDHPEIKRIMGDVSKLVDDWRTQGKYILAEAAQGFGLDIDHGTYPYSTSSSVVAGGACTGIGLGPKKIDWVIGVAKVAYATRVGKGPFPTELGGRKSEEHCARQEVKKGYELQMFGIPFEEKDGKISYNNYDPRIMALMKSDDDFERGVGLRLHGGEYGTTTNRPRRCGNPDSVILRTAARKNGVDEIVWTKFDVGTGLKTVKICDSYQSDGREIRDFPASLEGCEPNYIELPGWDEDIRNVRKKCNLPKNAIGFLDVLSDTLGNPEISMIGVGPERDQMIELSRYAYI